MKKTSSSLLCIAKDGVYENRKLGIQPRNLRLEYFTSVNGILLASYKNTMNLISEKWEILYTISLVKETSIVWPSELVWILSAHGSIFDCQTAILSPAFDISILCDSIEGELWGPRFNLKPVYCNKQMLWEPLIWISKGEMVEFEKTQRFSRNAISQENSLWWAEEDSGKGVIGTLV